MSARMPRASVNQIARDGIEPSDEQRYVTLGAHILGEDAVGAREDFTHLIAIASQDAQIRASLRHQQRRTNAVTRYVGDDNPQPPMKHGKEIKVVPASGLSRIRGTRDVEAGNLRCRFGKEPLLDLARDAELFFILAQLLLRLFA